MKVHKTFDIVESMETKVPRLIAGALTCLALTCIPALLAVEKYWIAAQADVVVVGKIRLTSEYRWFDGWHLNGDIRVDELLLGKLSVGSHLAFRFTCSCCPLWPPPHKQFTNEQGVWLLKRRDNRSWQTAGDC